MVVLVRNVCPLRGEEKSREDAGDPSRELVDKFKDWTYGDTPYIFACYAYAIGKENQVFILNGFRI